MSFSETTPQQITINTYSDAIEHPLLELLFSPAEPSTTPNYGYSIEVADSATTLNFGVKAATDIAIDFLAKTIKIPDLSYHWFTKTYTFKVKATDITRYWITAEYQLVVIVAGSNFNFKISS